jgi:hypothetical protein
VLSQADAELIATLGRLQQLRQALADLVASRLQRPWTAEEFFRYLALAADERRAHRHYLATRSWHEAALRRLRRTPPPAESPLPSDGAKQGLEP